MSQPPLCCDDLRSAYTITFLNPVPGQEEWLAYGTDFETASAGAPELRFWPVRFCPFCGTRLPVGWLGAGDGGNRQDAKDAKDDAKNE